MDRHYISTPIQSKHTQSPMNSPYEQTANDLNKKPVYESIKSYGKSGAIEIAPDLTTKGWNTVRLEAANKLNNGTKQYDWSKDNKVVIQLTKQELPLVIGVLVGYLPSVEFKNHGDTNKGFAIKKQPNNYFIKVYDPNPQNKRVIACPIPPVEAHLMGLLALKQHINNFDGITSDTALSMIKTLCIYMYKNNTYPKATE